MTRQKTEDERIRTRAVLVCKDQSFWEFLNVTYHAKVDRTDGATRFLYNHCNIESRGELAHNKYAQDKFKNLDREFMQWQNPIEKQYADNLNRE